MELKRVVVTGLGAITPVGNSVPEFWENIVNGVSGAGPITHFDASLFKTQFACEVKDFDATKYIDRKEARKMDLYTQYAIAVAKEAVSDSGLDVEKEDLNKIGVIFGAGIGGIHTFEEEVGNYYTRQEMGPKFNPFFIPKMISDIAAGQISIMYGFHGPNYATCSACATSTNAIADAFNLIRLGKANVIVSGGSEAAIFPAGVGGFNAMHALSTRNDEASKASRPFSASRDGFVMGEGGGCLILEELEHAKARGAKIYAEVAGVGMSADAHHLTASHPEGLGAKLVMKNALEDAGMDPIFQLACRDRNRIALESDLLSAAMLGIDNVLCLTGDHTKMGDHPQAKPVFDLDSVSLLHTVKLLESGVDLGGNELVGEPPKFSKGAVVSPCSDSVDAQLAKMERKVAAGAEYFQTQAVFEPEKFIKFMEKAKQFGKPVQVGIIIPKSAGMAKFMNNNVAGIHVPDEMIEELKADKERTKAGITGVEIAARIIKECKPYCQGVHIMALGWESKIPDLLKLAEI